jgi:hypothetical protein
MCQSTSTMRRKILDAFFSNFFSQKFLSLILTRHRKNKKKIFNFSIYLENYLLLRDRTKRLFFDEDENLHLKLLACSDLFDESIILLLFLFLFFFFSSFFFSLFIFIFFLFFSFFSREFEFSTFFERIRFETSTRFFFLTKERKSTVMSKRKRLKKRVDIINTFIDVSFRRSLKNVDL